PCKRSTMLSSAQCSPVKCSIDQACLTVQEDGIVPISPLQQTPVMWRGGDVADNRTWRCTETRCSYIVQQRSGLREDDDYPGLPRSDVLMSPHVVVWLGYAAR